MEVNGLKEDIGDSSHLRFEVQCEDGHLNGKLLKMRGLGKSLIEKLSGKPCTFAVQLAGMNSYKAECKLTIFFQ